MRTWWLVVGVALVGCAGGGDDGDDTDDTEETADSEDNDDTEDSEDTMDSEDTEDTSDTEELPPLSHEFDIQPIWNLRCDGCHINGGTSGGLDLTDGYSATLGVPANGADMNLLQPWDLENSYLFRKLAGTHLEAGGAGSRMPFGGELPDDELALIEAWILDGASP